ncbi:MAG: IS200/IS605 family transposase [Armatimonadota bacterium]
MADSNAEVYLHFVWATKGRAESIPQALERDLHRIIRSESQRLRCDVLALGGTLNHIHLLVLFSRTITLARYMEQIKGTSSRFLNENLAHLPDQADTYFSWQPGYGVFSVGINQTLPVIAYIKGQKEHHASGDIKQRWEPPDEFSTDTTVNID